MRSSSSKTRGRVEGEAHHAEHPPAHHQRHGHDRVLVGVGGEATREQRVAGQRDGHRLEEDDRPRPDRVRQRSLLAHREPPPGGEALLRITDGLQDLDRVAGVAEQADQAAGGVEGDAPLRHHHRGHVGRRARLREGGGHLLELRGPVGGALGPRVGQRAIERLGALVGGGEREGSLLGREPPPPPEAEDHDPERAPVHVEGHDRRRLAAGVDEGGGHAAAGHQLVGALDPLGPAGARRGRRRLVVVGGEALDARQRGVGHPHVAGEIDGAWVEAARRR